MNERIKQLAEQADDYADTYCDTIALSYSNWNTIRDVKFAELIVRECAKIADIADESKCEWIGGNILTQFGVKE